MSFLWSLCFEMLGVDKGVYLYIPVYINIKETQKINMSIRRGLHVHNNNNVTILRDDAFKSLGLERTYPKGERERFH